ncbi:hypothetical protein FXN61_29870 [Lentzea sp. PSKA42]|uniref:Uncharacterized protein n=1 Tax=Lentzea indica TaxID=2604800 RepID=A0ABX1FPN9_9PSEU|nr:hypothetical protein [Lentzea indica]NKE60769.1 hypothetical protein [Lentzea indica]
MSRCNGAVVVSASAFPVSSAALGYAPVSVADDPAAVALSLTGPHSFAVISSAAMGTAFDVAPEPDCEA